MAGASIVPPERMTRAGAFRVTGRVVMQPSRPDGFLTTAESARLAGVRPPTIRAWRAAGILAPQGLDERGYPLHTAAAVRNAEEQVRESAIEKGHFDPRQTRGRRRREAA
jgi:hypothetical protein